MQKPLIVAAASHDKAIELNILHIAKISQATVKSTKASKFAESRYASAKPRSLLSRHH